MQLVKLYKVFKESKGISIDTRTISPGQIYFALQGENVDGNVYAQQALDKGAMLAVVDKATLPTNPKFFKVEDSLTCLQRLAKYHRSTMSHPIIGVTGSNGKTTTKELISAVLSKRYRVSMTQGNFNNHLGVPLTLLEISPETEISIVEMGANHIGEIEDLCYIANPDLGLITNIGQAHLEGFGSFEGVVKAKTELYKHLDKNQGTIFYNQKDALLVSKLPSGTNNIPYLWEMQFLQSGLTLSYEYEGEKYSTHFYGRYNQFNIIAAFTIGRYFEVPIKDIHSAIGAYLPKMNRSQIKHYGKTCFIMDAYNANPSSMKLSLATFMEIESELPKVLVLGDMKELGASELDLHQEIVDLIKNDNWEKVVLVGALFYQTKTPPEFLKYEDVSSLIKEPAVIKKILDEKLILLKASRSTQLEQIETLYN